MLEAYPIGNGRLARWFSAVLQVTRSLNEDTLYARTRGRDLPLDITMPMPTCELLRRRKDADDISARVACVHSRVISLGFLASDIASGEFSGIVAN